MAGQAATSMLHSANQPALTNVDSNVIPEDSVLSTQDTNDPGSSSTIRTENLSNSFIDTNTSNNDSFSLSKSQSSSFMNSKQLEENETVPLNDKSRDNNLITNSKILNELRKEKMRQTNNISSKFKNDLVESIPGLYRLLDLCKDDGSNGLGI